MVFDKDLASIQQVRDLVRRAKDAQREYDDLSQEDVDKITQRVANEVSLHVRELAEMACEETGFGNVADKIIKNKYAGENVWNYIEHMKTRGIINIDAHNSIWDVGVAIGVIAALIPSTNPTSTTVYKSLLALKSGNAIIFSPHPAAVGCIKRTVDIIRGVLEENAVPADLVSMITIPTIEATTELMKRSNLILATGGKQMVKAAYSSGTPALGVGPGNVPAFIERSADIKKAVTNIIESKTFDNGVICASEQSVVVEECIKDAVKSELIRQGCYFVTPHEKSALERIIQRPNGTLNPRIVGKTPQYIGEMAGIKIADGVRVIIAEETGVGPAYPFSIEKLSPMLAFYAESDWIAACHKCIDILEYGGLGHSLSIHTQNEEILREFALKKPVSRIMVNTSSTHGAIGATTMLPPAFTLGCGAVGGSATSENISPLNLINIKKVAFGIREYQDIKAELVKQAEVDSGNDINNANGIDKELIEKLVEEVLLQLRDAYGR